MEGKCDECGKIFKTKPSILIRFKNHFCSRDCASDFKRGKPNLNMSLARQKLFREGYVTPFKGKHHTQEAKDKLSEANSNPSIKTRQKMRLAKEGKYLGSDNPFYGKKHSQATKDKISAANTGKKHGPSWNSGLSKYTEEWPKKVTINGKRMRLSCHVWLVNHPGEIISKSQVIHHIDLNPYNNHISNLMRMDAIEHRKLHIQVMKGLLNRTK